MSGGRQVPAQVTLPLLDLITRQSLDEDYQHVAERRSRGAAPQVGRPAARRRLTAVVVVGFGLLVSVAAVQTARNADVDTAGRATLVDRITERRTTVTAIQERIGTLRDANAALEATDRSIATDLERVTSRRTVLRGVTGFGAVTGEGVRAVVDDAPSGETAGLVRDSDLALLVNGLWSAGAEAIAVNGQRLTAVSALRNSDTVVRVNRVNLTPPYVVTAVGDRRTLQARFAETTSGARFRDLSESFGLPFTMENVEDLDIPAAPSRLLQLRSVSAAEPGQRPPIDQEDMP